MKWNEDLSIAIGKMNDRDRRNEMERPRYPGTEECHLFANNSLQIKERIDQRGRLRNRGLGLLYSPGYMQHHYSALFSTMNSLRAATFILLCTRSA